MEPEPPRGSKRVASSPLDPDTPTLERLDLTPLGGGNEVGRSCLLLRYKGQCIMLDCGILPSFSGLESLPWLGELDPAEVDVVFITHFHLDHAAALPHFTERLAGFRGRIFATHATIACMKLMLSDFVRVSSISSDDPKQLYNEADIDRCIARMEAVDFKQRLQVGGLQFMFYNAGHVLGAAMVLMEIAGVRVLYTGDYSCEEDRHLMAAEVPLGPPPDLLIVEATYGMQVHEPRMERERRFVDMVERVVRRGGRCLIPVFAVGRAQELLLILDEHWASKPDLQGIPIFFSSKLASRSMDVYRAYVSAMNARLQASVGERNPWDFRFVRALARPDDFRDEGPSVVLASPGMLQSGFSRQLFDRWAEDPRNGVVLAGYSVEGTMARRLESNPSEVETLAHRKISRRCGVERVSFSAHADSLQTSAFVDALRPQCIVLVHGEKTEMRKLSDGLSKRLEGTGAQVFMPPNGSTVSLNYAETRIVKVMGSLAARAAAGRIISGVLVQRHYEYMLLAPSDLTRYTALTTHSIAQKQHVPFRASFAVLSGFVRSMFDAVEEGTVDEDYRRYSSSAPPPGSGSRSAGEDAGGGGATSEGGAVGAGSEALVSRAAGAARRRCLHIADAVTAVHAPPDRIILCWSAGLTSDMVADSLVALIAQADVSTAALRESARSAAHAHAHAHSDPHAAAHGETGGGGGGEGCDASMHGLEGGGGGIAGDTARAGHPAALTPAWAELVGLIHSVEASAHSEATPGASGEGPCSEAAVRALLATLASQYGADAVRYCAGPHERTLAVDWPGPRDGGALSQLTCLPRARQGCTCSIALDTCGGVVQLEHDGDAGAGSGQQGWRVDVETGVGGGGAGGDADARERVLASLRRTLVLVERVRS